MLLFLLSLACNGDRFADQPYAVERSPPWNTVELPEGRTVVSTPRSLVVRTQSDPRVLDRTWNTALLAAGFEVSDDHSRDTSIVRSYARADTRWSLSITAMGEECTVRLAELESP